MTDELTSHDFGRLETAKKASGGDFGEEQAIERELENANMSRWTKYGHDRIYFNDVLGGSNKLWLDLKTGEVESKGPSASIRGSNIEIDNGKLVVNIHVYPRHYRFEIDLLDVEAEEIEDVDESDEDEDNSEKQLVADGGEGKDKDDNEDDLLTDGGEVAADVDLLSTPEIRVETGAETRVFEDALDAEISIRDGDLPPGGIVWAEVSNMHNFVRREIPDFNERVDEYLETGEYDYIEDAQRDVVRDLDEAEIDSTGTYLFECETCGHEECPSAVDLKHRHNCHRINDQYYHDEDGKLQKREGHAVKTWKLIGTGDIARLADDIRDETTRYTPFVWVLNDMKIEGYGADTDADNMNTSRIHDLIREGLSPAEAVDYHMTVDNDMTQKEWAAERRQGQQTISQQAVSKNVRKAREKLGE